MGKYIRLSLVTIFFVFHAEIYAQEAVVDTIPYFSKKYSLYDIHENSDFNYQAIESIDKYSRGLSMMDSVFQTIKGDYTVYRFLCHEKGELWDESGERDIWRLIILKFSLDGFVIDGYQYHLTNAEHPATCRLYRSSCWVEKKDSIDIEQLRFKRREYFYDWSDEDYCWFIPLYLNETGKLFLSEKQ